MRRRRVGFTLIEMMVTVAVVSVLLGLTLPALRGARVTADSTACLVSLSSIAKMQAAYAAGTGGRWPNDFEKDTTPSPTYFFNNTGWTSVSPIGQSVAWPGPLSRKGYYDRDEPTQGVSCPVVYRSWRDTRIESDNQDLSPSRSYLYSPAMFTESNLWDPSSPFAERARVGSLGSELPFSKNVRTEEVKYLSRKVVMSERVDNHGRGAILGDPGLTDSERSAARANVSFADGHVDRVEPYRAQEPLVVNWKNDVGDGLFAIPFSAAAWGYRGRDY